MSKLFHPYDLAGLALPNRIVMAPMTRSRAETGVPDALTALYYRQRASAGLIVTEGAPVSQEGTGYLYTPGIYTQAQTAAWKQVTDAVHEDGGRIFVQLWHVGRISHVSLQTDGQAPVSPVARRALHAQAYAWVSPGVAGQVPVSEPRAVATDEVARLIEDFVAAGRNAVQAGFDGVELHAANGYLFEQFINGELNTRQDRYGGSIANRLRLLLETVDALGAAIGSQRIGVRISPFGRLNDMHAFPDEAQTWLTLARELSHRNPAYIHYSDQHTIGGEPAGDFLAAFRKAYDGTLIIAGGLDRDRAETALRSDAFDLAAFGRPFIANPDLVERLANGWPLASVEDGPLYGLYGARGYTDYPCFAKPESAAPTREQV
ncbi:alkene reductase [Pseudomonas aeruginosa]|nr:alkene reductase [Pseudomonas aeruginosa]